MSVKTKKRKIPITPRERRYMKQYTVLKHLSGEADGRCYSVHLQIGVQQFHVDGGCLDQRSDAQWLRWQLAKALITLVGAEKGKEV